MPNADKLPDGRTTVAGTFADTESAHQAAHRLHNEGFNEIWHGQVRLSHSSPEKDNVGNDMVTAGGERHLVVAGDDNVMDKLGRFFSGESDESLTDALARHGILSSDSARLQASLKPNTSILTVDGANHPDFAAQIITDCGGAIVSGAGSLGKTPQSAEAQQPQAASSADAVADTAGSGTNERRIQLREERLRINKERASAGDVTLNKVVEENRQSIDVPTFREEIFVERRQPESSVATGVIGDGQTLTIPLTEERVIVSKDTVVAEEVLVGKRRVNETEEVDETLRRERLVVDGQPMPADEPGAESTTRL